MIEFGWGDYEETYSVLTFTGKWTTREFGDVVRALYKDIRESDKPINMIVDLRYSDAPPMNIMGITTTAIMNRPSNFGQVIVVSRSNIWKRLFEAITFNYKGAPLNIYFAETIDAAYQQLVAVSNK